jgi:DNA-binding response OmpR family regulator
VRSGARGVTGLSCRERTLRGNTMRAAVAADASPILVVDDDAKIVQLVRTYLEREGFAVTTATDGPGALAAFRDRRPRLVVLDVMLPTLDGLAITRIVRAESDVPILMLSARGATADRVLGINEGADDYVTKPFSPAELVGRVKAILRRTERLRERMRDDKPVRFRDLVIDLSRHEVRRGDDQLDLTSAELRLLLTLIEADGRILTREVLLDALYGSGEGEVLERSVDVYVRRLREKLGDDADRPRYIATVRGAGYRTASEA